MTVVQSAENRKLQNQKGKIMKHTILLGGYTSRVNQGIGQVTLDTEKKQLADYHLIYAAERPTYLLEKDGCIYVCMKRGENGGVAMIRDGQEQAAVVMAGAAPCHISADPNRPYFYVSWYHQGMVSVIEKTADGLAEKCRIAHQGRSVHPNQEKPHVHFAQISPCGRYLFVCDLGTDEVYLYSLQADGTLQEYHREKTPAGFGPRHLTFHPQLPFIYVLGELSSQVLVLEMESNSGRIFQRQLISALPEDFQGENAAAAIRISRDGRYLYTSNRGHDSLAVFQVEADGRLCLVEYVPTEGRIPRDFALSPEEDFLVAAHQDSDNLTLFARDQESGRLTLCQKGVYAPEYVCVFFAD